jgi:hypothetical protein
MGVFLLLLLPLLSPSLLLSPHWLTTSPTLTDIQFPTNTGTRQVTEMSEGNVDIPYLSDTFADLYALLELAQRTLDKLNAFVGHPRFFQR